MRGKRSVKYARLWECKNWGKYIDWECRSGIRLRFEKGVDPEVSAHVQNLSGG